jgi:hypothetical protein
MVPVVIAGNILGEATTPSGNIFNEATRGPIPTYESAKEKDPRVLLMRTIANMPISVG